MTGCTDRGRGGGHVQPVIFREASPQMVSLQLPDSRTIAERVICHADVSATEEM